MALLIICLILTAITCFMLYLRCICVRHDKNCEKLLQLNKRLEEIENKLHMLICDLELTTKNKEVLLG